MQCLKFWNRRVEVCRLDTLAKSRGWMVSKLPLSLAVTNNLPYLTATLTSMIPDILQGKTHFHCTWLDTFVNSRFMCQDEHLRRRRQRGHNSYLRCVQKCYSRMAQMRHKYTGELCHLAKKAQIFKRDNWQRTVACGLMFGCHSKIEQLASYQMWSLLHCNIQ